MTLDGLGISNTSLTNKEWIMLRRAISGNRRLLFSNSFIHRELDKLEDFRGTFRDIMSLLDKRKEFIRFLFTEPEGSDLEQSPDKNWFSKQEGSIERSEHQQLRSQILYMLSQ